MQEERHKNTDKNEYKFFSGVYDDRKLDTVWQVITFKNTYTWKYV